MKFLSPKLHGLGDYAAAVALIIGPFIFDVAAQSSIAHWFSIAGGVGLIIYSLFTDYTFSLAGRIPFKVHLMLDVAAGIGFLVAPVALGLSGMVSAYFYAMGAGVLLVVAVTDTQTTAVTE